MGLNYVVNVPLEQYLDTFNIFYSIVDYKLSRIVDDQGPSNIKATIKVGREVFL